jgi:RecA-family ATPase
VDTQEKYEFLRDLIETYRFYIFPLTASNTPFKGFKWRQSSSNRPEDIERWLTQFPECNWAVDCGKSGITVVDLDRHGKADGIENFLKRYLDSSKTHVRYRDKIADLKNILSAASHFPGVFAETPRNGAHLIYTGKHRCCSHLMGSPKRPTGIDIRSDGGYIAIKPSIRFRKAYTLHQVGPLTPLPAWIAQKLQDPKKKAEGGIRPTEKTDSAIFSREDMPGILAQAEEYINAAPIAIEGEGGDAHTYKVVCKLRDLGVPEDACLVLMSDHWNGRCEPPWELEDLEKKIENAYRYAENEIGARSLSEIYKDALPPDGKLADCTGQGGSTKKEIPDLFPEIVYFQSLLSTPPPQREWLIDGWIPSGAGTFFTGPGGTGKSMIAMQLSASIAHGVPWLGLEVATSRPVILLMCEDSIDEIHRRGHGIGNSLAYVGACKPGDTRCAILPRLGKRNRLCLSDRDGLKPTEFYLAVTQLLRAHYRGLNPFIILDTVTDVYGLNENDRSPVNDFVKQLLGAWTVELGATFMALGHPPKGTAQYSGSTGWDTAFRQRLFLDWFSEEADRLTDYRRLESSKSNYSAKGQHLILQYATGIFKEVSGNNLVDAKEQRDLDTIYAIIKEHAEQTPPNQVSADARGNLPIAHMDIRDDAGRMIPLPKRKELITKLKSQGLVYEIKGEKRRNGLYQAK